ncbi:MAG: hypothetical protein U0935_16540 [Pirellulales bacterium]
MVTGSNQTMEGVYRIDEVRTPDKISIRVVSPHLTEGNYEDIAEFYFPKTKGAIRLDMKIKHSRRDLREIQRQIFFCVLEIRDIHGKPRFIALQPAVRKEDQYHK